MAYYRNSVTDQSWQFLKKLKKEFTFCLIGGWAIWLYTEQLKSKDIDIVVEAQELTKIRKKYELFKNERLKKYEFRQGEIQIDVYSAYYSDLGIKAETVLKQTRIVEGFSLPKPETLLILKLSAWLDRRASPKGKKDLLDMISLLLTDKAKLTELKHPNKYVLVKELRLLTAVPELNLNQHQWGRIKKSWLTSR
jgi:hypothetical protein